jgi:hypothetical protein
MKKITLVCLMVVCGLLVTAKTSLACSCLFDNKPLKQQVKDSYQGSSAVFAGEVLEITSKDEWSVSVRIKVEKSWKGKFSKEITITTAKDSAMCGYGFVTGQKYLIYTSGEKNDPRVNNCSRTTLFSNKQDLKYLERLKRTKGKSV